MKGIALPLPENRLCTGCQYKLSLGHFQCRSTAVSIKYRLDLKQKVVKCFSELCCLKADKSLITVGDSRRQTRVYTDSYVLI